ncbi:MAG: response regulator [Myxococcota bacterium]
MSEPRSAPGRPLLRVLIVAADASTAEFAERVLADHGDHGAVANDVPDALHLLAKQHFDVALVSLSLPRGDGLALVHHLRALYPDIDVLVMSLPAELQETAHAMALGVLSSIMLPLTGDGLMVPMDRARERRVLIDERRRLAEEGAVSKRRTATYARCAAFVSETDASVVAERLLEACLAELSATAGAVYLPDGASKYVRVATVGAGDRKPKYVDESTLQNFDPTEVVIEEDGGAWVVFLGGSDIAGLVWLETAEVLSPAVRDALEVVTAMGTAALDAARKVAAIARTGIKHPHTSAYTFAYFGDVAGREIDRAARHNRRFSLVTLSLEDMDVRRSAGQDRVEFRRAIADALLEAVRDSDVLARVEDDEFYLLLPESGLLGALACRRRIAERLGHLLLPGTDAPLDPVAGIAVYPVDGSDLGRLLRVSRRRAERSRVGVWRRLGLGQLSFWDAVTRVLGSEDDAVLARDGSISLHPDLHAAHDDASMACHAAMSRETLPHLASAIASDAMARKLAGTLYVAGDDPLSAAVARIVEAHPYAPLRAWSLTASPEARSTRVHLAVGDARVDRQVFLLSLTELGGYTLIGRQLSSGALLTYHASDLDLVDGLVSALQSEYHLQPEVR